MLIVEPIVRNPMSFQCLLHFFESETLSRQFVCAQCSIWIYLWIFTVDYGQLLPWITLDYAARSEK